MSLDATRWAWKQSLAPTRKLVLLALADRAGENHECYPSIARLTADTGMYRETIMEAIRDMEALGLLTVKRRNGAGSVYRLIGVEDRHEDGSTGLEKPTGRKKHTGMEKPTPTSREKPTPTSREKPTVNLSTESTSKPTKRETDTREGICEKGDEERREEIVGKLKAAGIVITSMSKDLCQWVNSGVTDAELGEALERARAYKPEPEKIPVRYLAPIVIQVIGERASRKEKAPEAGRHRPGLHHQPQSRRQGDYATYRQFDNSAPGKIERAYAERRAREAAESAGGGGDGGQIIDLGAGDYQHAY